MVMTATTFIFVLCSIPSDVKASEQVRGHVTKSGKYVAPHLRSKANKNKKDNFGSKGNTNPYTGKRGKKKPDLPS